jgi:hypothetical protein
MDKGPVTDGVNVGYEVRTNGDNAGYAKKHTITNYNRVSFWTFSIWIGIGLVVMVFLMRIRKASAASGKISK